MTQLAFNRSPPYSKNRDFGARFFSFSTLSVFGRFLNSKFCFETFLFGIVCFDTLFFVSKHVLVNENFRRFPESITNFNLIRRVSSTTYIRVCYSKKIFARLFVVVVDLFNTALFFAVGAIVLVVILGSCCRGFGLLGLGRSVA